MKKRAFLLLSCIAVLLSGCANLMAPLTATKSSSLTQGQSVPAGKVLLIGKVVLTPQVKDNNPFQLALTHDLSKPVKKGGMVPISPDERIEVIPDRYVFIPVDPGTKYIRLGQYRRVTGFVSRTGRPLQTGWRRYSEGE